MTLEEQQVTSMETDRERPSGGASNLLLPELPGTFIQNLVVRYAETRDQRDLCRFAGLAAASGSLHAAVEAVYCMYLLTSLCLMHTCGHTMLDQTLDISPWHKLLDGSSSCQCLSWGTGTAVTVGSALLQ